MYQFMDEIQNELNRLGVKRGNATPLATFLGSNWYTAFKRNKEHQI